MTGSHSSENIAAENESSLKTLVRAIRLFQGQFGLILMRCNDGALRDAMAQRLRELSPAKIREIVLPPSAKSFYTIKAELGDEQPEALMVFGLELVSEIDDVLLGFTSVHGEPRGSFPFLLLFWVNDEVLEKIRRLTPDLASWATNIEFVLTKEDYL
ncbi:MAG TPA: hypothetical protein V6C95_01160 [Coleofasciculaceae cyanobacterium]